MTRIVAALGLALLTAPFAAAVDFDKDVQPVLARSCFSCHSASLASAGLRLDSRATALKVITPGNSADSRLIQRVEAVDAAKRMPLGGKPLDPAQIAIIRKWIDEGALWPEGGPKRHWAYVKPVRPPLPPGDSTNPIDRFVFARLQKEGLKPSPQASKETLIRRVTIDLTGLPPTLPEIDAFLADQRPDAYERVVDRLLASPHFGERWARPWLDLARYADTNGYEKDERRSIWKYRDWVIDALNKDMPYDEFTVEQIAGDMLPNATIDQKIATGFNRNTMFNEEGGVDKEEEFWQNLVDRVGTTSTVWLGATLGCAQCHNHKFDPFTQKEFYQFMAFFNNGEKNAVDYGDTSQKWVEPKLDLPTPEQQIARKKLQDEIKRIEQKIKTADLEHEQADWERGIRNAASTWKTLAPQTLAAKNGTVITPQKDGSILASGPNPSDETITFESKASAVAITAIRLEVLPDPSLPRGGPGRDIYGNCYISDIQIDGARIKQAVPDNGSVKLREKGEQLWSVDASRDDERLPRQLVLIPDKPLDAAIRLTIHQQSEFGGQGMGRFRLTYTTEADPKVIVGVSAKLRPVLFKDQRTAAERKDLADFYRNRAESLRADRDQLKDLRKQLDNLGIASTLVFQESASYNRPSTEMRLRGQFLSKGDTVYAAVPAALNPLPESELPNRLGLARWIASKDNPLTARVEVNRIWEQYFGRGIVETSEDFGTQGERPTHPELLDWLAVEFMDKGWSMKAIHRLIVTSAAYKQDSHVTPELIEKDPYNRLLARGPRFRMEAEMIRDAALEASGLLSLKIGGPSVFPPQPDGVWDLPYNDDSWTVSKGEDKYRRGLYTFLRRTAPYPSLLTFDGTSRESCTVRRIRTNTPLQALTTLNDPAFFEAAQALAKRATKEGGSDDQARIVYAFRLCTARQPKPAELDRLLQGLERERSYFSQHPAESARLGDTNLAAWTMLSNVLLNLDETITKE
jgi:hypothetical protein